MVTETAPMVKRPRFDYYPASMEPTGRAQSPTSEKVCSAAVAMLKLSTSVPNLPVFVLNHEAGGGGAGFPASLPTIGQPPVAYMAQQHDAAVTTSHELVDTKPDITQLNLADCDMAASARMSRKQREFIPEFKKDDHYWTKRRKNNEAAKRSREKRRMNDMALSGTVAEVKAENDMLRRELQAIKAKFGLPLDQHFPFDPSEPLVPLQSFSDSSDNMSCEPCDLRAAESSSSPANPTFPPAHEMKEEKSKQPEPHHQGVPPVPSPPTVLPAGSSLIPFLIPVNAVSSNSNNTSGNSSGNQPPMTVIAHLPSATVTMSPAVLTSLSLTPAMLGGDPRGAPTNGHGRDAGPWAPLGDTWTDAPLAFGGRLTPPQDESAGDSPTGSLHIVTSSASDFSEGDTAVNSYSRALNLCKREIDGPAPAYIEIKPCPLLAIGDDHPELDFRGSKCIPLKLRHKLAEHLRGRGASTAEEAPGGEATDETAPPEEEEVESGDNSRSSDGDSQAAPHESFDSSSSEGGVMSCSSRNIGCNNTSIDPKYVERRQRNNQAARKCRENRKLITDLRLAKSTVLETENQRLKDELQSLTTEVSTLRDLIEMKNAAKAKGELFEPPPLHKDGGQAAPRPPSPGRLPPAAVPAAPQQ